MNIRQFSQDEFSALKHQWQDLLLRSDADSLFLSWDWMYSWWQVWAQDDFELLLLGAYNGDQLVGIAPLYSKTAPSKLLINSRYIEFIGTSSTSHFGFRTEYLEFLADRSCAAEAVQSLFNWIANEATFDEMRLNDIVKGSATHRCALGFAEYGHYIRLQEASQTYGIDTHDAFDSYVKRLGKNSRLKVFNRRKVLEDLGDVTLETIHQSNFGEVLDHLSEFHLRRWGRHISYKNHRNFIDLLCNDSDKSVSGIIIRLDGKLLGCTFDVDCGNTCYNFQLGFADNVDKKISMGSLTIGYAAERCFNNPHLEYYDLLAGEGKHSNYKNRIATAGKQFESLQIVSSPLFKSLYRIKDILQDLRST